MNYPKASPRPRSDKPIAAGKAKSTTEPETYPADAIRLGKYIATAGVASRRHSEELIRQGDVSVNGRIIIDPAFPVRSSDHVEFQGKVVSKSASEELYVVMLHKPVGVISTMAPGNEKGYCLSDLVHTPERLHPVGRLDQDSSGLILLTNDGELTLRLTHPSHEIEKEYLVKIQRILHPKEFEKIGRGILIDDRIVRVSDLEVVQGGRIRIVIHEGRNRIIRRLFGALRCNVLELRRTRIGPISLGKLGVGKWRKLSQQEYLSLKENRR